MTWKSGWFPASKTRQLSHRVQGASCLGLSHRKSLPSAAAVVDFPTPTGPANIRPCGRRSARYARRIESIAALWPKMSRNPFMSEWWQRLSFLLQVCQTYPKIHLQDEQLD